MHQVTQLTTERVAERLTELVELLQDAVQDGASLGFLPPLSVQQAQRYWQDVTRDIAAETRVCLVAIEDDAIVGSVQLDLATKPNALHRAEVQKLCVATRCRNQGIGRALMHAAEDVARTHERTLLVLDTRQGDAAEQLYMKWGYTVAGVIPQYARSADGVLHGTVFFHKQL